MAAPTYGEPRANHANLRGPLGSASMGGGAKVLEFGSLAEGSREVLMKRGRECETAFFGTGGAGVRNRSND